MTFETGIKISPKDIMSLRSKTNVELSNGVKLQDLHFYVSGQDRQTVALARQLLSESVAAILTTEYPDDPAKQALAHLISTASKCFDVLTSEGGFYLLFSMIISQVKLISII